MPGLELWTVALLLDISIKAALLATAAWIGMALFRVRSSHLQHRLWLLVLVGMLLLPALVHLAPSISLPHWLYPDLQLTAADTELEPGLPALPAPVSQNEPEQIDLTPLEAPSFESTHTPETTPGPSHPLVATNLASAASSQFAIPEAPEPLPIPLAVVLPEPQPVTRTNSAALAVLAIYLIGLAVQTLRLLIGMAWTQRLLHRARPVETPLAKTWLPGWATLAESTELRVPVTIGYWRPVVMLPADWTTWSEQFLSMVLAHEAEHVRRRDTWAALLATLNTAVFWFHPVAWLVRRRLTDLAEQICDDEVIRITGSRGDYAQNLLAMAGRLTSDPRRLAPVGVAMARKANVVKRIEAIIDRDRPLSRRIGTLAALLLLTTVVPVVFVAAGLRATDPSQAAEAEPVAEGNADPDNDNDAEPLADTAEAQDGGRKFVYVLDRSLSMAGAEHSALEAAKAEAIASLGSLEDTHRFQFVFYNETPKTFNSTGQQGEPALATDQNKQRVSQFVESLTALGQAEHEAALQLAIRMQPHVIFLLTAARAPQLSDHQLYEIQRQAAGIQINTIEFGSEPNLGGDNFLAKLARQNGGQYVYRDITTSADGASEPASAATSLKGRVVLASDGSPVVGAEVRLLTWKHRGLDQTETTTNEKGEFQFNQLIEGRKTLTAYYESLSSRTRRYKGYEAKAGEEGIVLELREAPSLKVKVVTRAEGKPLENATVRLTWTDAQRDHKTDANGEVLIQGLTPETWTIESHAEGFAEDVQAVNLSGTGITNVVARVDPGVELYGVVRDEEGEGLADVGISVFPSSGMTGGQIEHGKTEADGSFRFPYLPVMGFTLILAKEGYVDYRPDVTLAVSPGERQELNLTLPRRPDGGSVQGIVVDTQGDPVAGATIINRGATVPRDTRKTTTDAEGRYRLDDVFDSLGDHRLFISAEGFAPQILDFEPGKRESPTELNITLEPGHHVRGRVVNEQGKPLAGVQIYYGFNQQFSGSEYGGTATTDSEGRFEMNSLSAAPPIRFSKSGYPHREDTLLPLDGDDEVVVTMQSAGVIRGHVVDDRTGRPVIPFTVRVTFSPDRKPDEPSGSLSGARAFDGETFAAEDATFRMGDFIQGMPLQVNVTADGYDPAIVRRVVTMPEAEAETVEFRLTSIDKSELLSIAGRLVNEKKEPLPGAELRLIIATKRSIPRDAFPFNWAMIRSGQTRKQDSVLQFLVTATDPEGRFRFDQVRAGGDIELACWGEGVSQNRKAHLEKMSAEELENLTITTETPGIVRGSINRKAYPNISSIVLSGNQGFFEANLPAKKDPYEVRNVPEGDYELQIYVPFQRMAENGSVMRYGQVRVNSGETVTLNIEKAPSSPLPLDPDTANKPASQAPSPSIPTPFTGPPPKKAIAPATERW